MIELMSISREVLLELCDLYPRSQAIIQEHCIRQVQRLSKIRARKEHLHRGNYCDHFYRKSQVFLDLKARGDLTLEVKTLNKKQLEEKTGETLDRLVPRFDEVLAELGEKS